MPRPSPHQLVSIWHKTPPGRSQEDRIIAFGNHVASYCLDESCDAAGRVMLKDLDIPTMAYGALRRAGFQYADQIRDFDLTRLMEIKNIGPSMASQIMTAIRNLKS